jgi:phospholipase D1/2
MPEALVPYENIEERIKQLEQYLQNLLQISLYRNHHETVSVSMIGHEALSIASGCRAAGQPVLQPL